MNVTRTVIDVAVWLTPVAVVATPFVSDRLRLVLAAFLLFSLSAISVVGVWRFYRSSKSPDPAASTDKKVRASE